MRWVMFGFVLLTAVVTIYVAAPPRRAFKPKIIEVPVRSAPQVVVMDVGAEPRQPLRIKVAKGTESMCRCTMQLSVTQTINDWPLPPDKVPLIELVMRELVTDVRSNGDSTWELILVSATVLDEPEFPPEMLKKLRDTYKSLEGARHRFTTTDRGVVLHTEVILSNPDAELRNTLEQIFAGITEKVEPLPKEPVGVGARWGVKKTTKYGYITVQQESVYTLQRCDGEGIQITATATQTAGEQDADFYRALVPQKGGKVRLQSLKGTTSGDCTFSANFGSIVRARQTSTTVQNLNCTLETEQYSMAHEVKLDFTIVAEDSDGSRPSPGSEPADSTSK